MNKVLEVLEIDRAHCVLSFQHRKCPDMTEKLLTGMLSTKPIKDSRGGSRISGKGVHMYKGVWVRFADFVSFCLNIP